MAEPDFATAKHTRGVENAQAGTWEDATIVVADLKETLRIWLEDAVEAGKITYEKAKELWAEWEIAPRSAAAYFATGQDALLIAKVVKDLRRSFGRVYYKTYNGAQYIIFKGYAGLRSILTGTRYGVKNPKIVSMGIGPHGARASIRQGGILSVVLLTAVNVIDYVLTDEMTLADLIGQMASDVVKVGIATGASIAAATAVGTAGVIASVAVGPLIAAVVVGVGVALVLDHIDNRFQLTEKLKDYLNRTAAELHAEIEARKQAAKRSLLDMTARLVENLVREATAAVAAEIRRRVAKKLRELTWYEIR